MKSIFLLALLVVALGAGCASQTPTVGELMIEQSQGTKDLGKQWKAGHKLVSTGESDVAEGKKTITNGEARVKQGEAKIAEGQKMKEEAELIFKTRFPNSPFTDLNN